MESVQLRDAWSTGRGCVKACKSIHLWLFRKGSRYEYVLQMLLKQEQAELAASSIDTIVNGSSSSNGKEPVVAAVEPNILTTEPSCDSSSSTSMIVNTKETPNRCITCRLTAFNCWCGNLYCAGHCYSDKPKCTFDY